MMKQLKAWWHNARPTSLMQSMMPACLAVVLDPGHRNFQSRQLSVVFSGECAIFAYRSK